MAEYIERETVMKIIDDYGCTHGGTLGSHSGAVDVVGSAIYKLPAADVAPVKHGHWKSVNGIVRCSNCEYVPSYERAIDDFSIQIIVRFAERRWIKEVR